jgi:hypothetical protein
MKNIKFNYLGIVLLLAIFITSCVGDLNVEPIDPNQITSATVYQSVGDYEKGLAKLYATFALSGQQGPDGQPDIEGIDEGFGNYLRQYWNSQVLSTDEAVLSWNDATIKDFHYQTWTPTDVFLAALYSRIMYTVALSNEFIRATADSEDTAVKRFHAEARFLRALAYSHAIDLFGNPSFVTEEDLPGAFFPEQILRSDLFSYIESELIDIESDLGDPKFEYGRADKAAAWMVLAKLYLNAEVYINQPKYTECIDVLNKVITGPHSLADNYRYNFVSDNNDSPEIIFPINYDGVNTQSWGGMVYLIHAQIGGTMKAYDMFGTADAWAGLRTTSALVDKFDMNNDLRALFWTDGQSKEINDIGVFTDGYAVTKFRNRKLDGSPSNSNHNVQVDTDWPMFRLSDAYLMYVEAVLRGGQGGSRSEALDLVNQIRTRAYGNDTGNISDAELTLDFILDERARELFWEGQRRTDLIRFGKFTGGAYVWPWKGNTADGVATDTHRDLYPIPSAEIGANPNIQQNPGYSGN